MFALIYKKIEDSVYVERFVFHSTGLSLYQKQKALQMYSKSMDDTKNYINDIAKFEKIIFNDKLNQKDIIQQLDNGNLNELSKELLKDEIIKAKGPLKKYLRMQVPLIARPDEKLKKLFETIPGLEVLQYNNQFFLNDSTVDVYMKKVDNYIQRLVENSEFLSEIQRNVEELRSRNPNVRIPNFGIRGLLNTFLDIHRVYLANDTRGLMRIERGNVIWYNNVISQSAVYIRYIFLLLVLMLLIFFIDKQSFMRIFYSSYTVTTFLRFDDPSPVVNLLFQFRNTVATILGVWRPVESLVEGVSSIPGFLGLA